jgi:hypothetical protein
VDQSKRVSSRDSWGGDRYISIVFCILDKMGKIIKYWPKEEIICSY